MPIPDPNIQATATALLRGRGVTRALAFTDAQSEACLSRNDPNGEAVWRRIAETIRRIEAGRAADAAAPRQPVSWLSRALRARRECVGRAG